MSQTCPYGHASSTDDQYCEMCGYDFVSGTSHAGWIAEIRADRAYYELLAPEGIVFPDSCPTRVVEIDADATTIGRRRATHTVEPDIDLSGHPEDAGVSHLHATLVRGPDGSLAIVDEGSTNGTTINDDPMPIAAHAPVPVRDGDRIHIGAWTTITFRAG